MKDNFGGFLKEHSGACSCMRLVFSLWAVGVLSVWVFTCLHKGAIEPLPESIVTILGIVTGGKVVQRFGEKPHDSPND